MIYLYVKRHSITGLKYFGKTERSNPFKYNGSGKYWQRHINKYGKEHIQTIELYSFDNQELCTEFALKFSKDNNIIESKEWANLKQETGLDGGDTSLFRFYTPLSETAKAKMIQSKLGKIPWNKGKKTGIGGNKNPKTLEQKAKLKQAGLGKLWWSCDILEKSIQSKEENLNKDYNWIRGRKYIKKPS